MLPEETGGGPVEVMTGGSGNAAATGGTGGTGIVLPQGTGGEPEGTGGIMEPVIRDGGLLPLTVEQVALIQEAECTGLSEQAERVPPALELVVDVSLSMGDPAPGSPEGVNKWDVTQAALLAALDQLPDEMAVGLQVFPTAEPGAFGGAACVDASGAVAIAPLGPPGATQRLDLADKLNSAALILGTPTHDAYNFALEEGLGAYAGSGQRFMLLITDGAPTQVLGCGPLVGEGVETDPIVETVIAAAADDISTFVIGSPGSEANQQSIDAGLDADWRGWLSQAAVEGRTAAEGCVVDGPNFCHFDMTQATDFGVALAEGLAAIATQVNESCDFELPAAPDGETIDPDLTNVILDWTDGTSVLVLRDDVDVCTEGWVLRDDGRLELCPTTCEAFKADQGALVSVSLGCNVEDIEIIVK